MAQFVGGRKSKRPQDFDRRGRELRLTARPLLVLYQMPALLGLPWAVKRTGAEEKNEWLEI
jgi:hypothetical protein